MKSAKVTLLIMKPSLDKNNPKQNYRPVSNLSFVSKVIEQLSLLLYAVMCTTINWRILKSWLIVLFTILKLRVRNDILWNTDEQKAVALILLDLSVTFDTVDNNIPLRRMERRLDSRALY